MIQPSYDIIVIGAGPAGLSAASLAAQQGAKTLLLDEQNHLGGQIYRNIEGQSQTHFSILGADYQHGQVLVEDFKRSSADYSPQSRVWLIDDNNQVGINTPDKAEIICGKKLILAAGAMERPVPFSGWTLPGVMNAGAGQVLLKAQGLVPDSSTILAGSGPLLLLLAWQYLQAGIKVQAILDMTPMKNHFNALRYLPKALLAQRYIRKGLFYEWQLKKAGIKIIRSVKDIIAEGAGHLQHVQYTRKNALHTLNCEHLFVHFGVIPSTQLAQVAQCQIFYDTSQQCWRPQTNVWGRTSKPNIYIVGDGAGIAGAKSAEYAGKLAALDALKQLDLISEESRDRFARPLFDLKRQDNHIRPFLEAYFRIPDNLLVPQAPDTIVCRCEEITAQQIQTTASEGHTDNNQVKFLTRAGMGPCQGRQCASCVSHIIANTLNKTVAEIGSYRARAPVNTLSIGELASLYPEEQE